MTPGPALTVLPLPRPPDVTVRVPGSKSLTNRALLCAALAPGRSVLRRALVADDTAAMTDAVRALGAMVEAVPDADGSGTATLTVTGTELTGGQDVTVLARRSGATSRLVLPVAAVRSGTTTVDGAAQLRARPFGPQVDALRALGAVVEELGEPGRLPLRVTSPARGGEAAVPADVSSQFVSGLLLAGPLMPRGLHLRLTTDLVSAPYLDLTRDVMAAFGVRADGLSVAPGRYVPTERTIEPDASSASYFLGAAAVTGGRVTVDGLGTGSAQGDAAFADLLARMGATVERTADSTTVTGPSRLRGIDADLRHVSDTAQTLAAVAVFADSPTRVRGIGNVRFKETDRIAAVVTELRRAGIEAHEHDDGFTVVPGTPRPTVFSTYDDHRMAMSLSLLGLRHDGMTIDDPGCVAKTYPTYWQDLDRLRR